MGERQLMAVDDRHAILSIMVKPRDTIRYVLNTKNLYYFILVGIIGMFSSSLASFVGEKLNGTYTLGDVVYSTFISSVLMYFLSTLLSASVLTLSAKAFGGKGTFKEMFRMISVTMMPYIWILPLLLFWMQFSPQSFFDISYMENSVGDYILQFIGATFFLIASIWSFILTIIGISEVHKITKLRAFFASIMIIVILAILTLVVLF